MIEPKNPTASDDHIGDLAGLRAHHQVFDAPETLVLWAAHIGAEQLVGPE